MGHSNVATSCDGTVTPSLGRLSPYLNNVLLYRVYLGLGKERELEPAALSDTANQGCALLQPSINALLGGLESMSVIERLGGKSLLCNTLYVC